MRLFNDAQHSRVLQRFACFISYSPALINEARQLSERIFAQELACGSGSDPEPLEGDDVAAFCDHLIVYDFSTKRVVGYARLLNELQANLAGGFQAQTQFELQSIFMLRGRFLEVGKICIDPGYRNGAVLSALWRGLARFSAEGGYNYLFGATPTAADHTDFAAVALLAAMTRKNFPPPELKVKPLIPIPADMRSKAINAEIPPLLKTYLKLGAWICGEPSWDRNSHTMKSLVLLPLELLKESYARHYLQIHRQDFRAGLTGGSCAAP